MCYIAWKMLIDKISEWINEDIYINIIFTSYFSVVSLSFSLVLRLFSSCQEIMKEDEKFSVWKEALAIWGQQGKVKLGEFKTQLRNREVFPNS